MRAFLSRALEGVLHLLERMQAAVPITYRLAGSMIVALALLIGATVFAFDQLREDTFGRRVVLVQTERRMAEADIPKLLAYYRSHVPRPDLPLPTGDPLPTLRRMLSPVVPQAFFLAPDGRLTVLGTSRLQHGRPLITSYRNHHFVIDEHGNHLASGRYTWLQYTLDELIYALRRNPAAALQAPRFKALDVHGLYGLYGSVYAHGAPGLGVLGYVYNGSALAHEAGVSDGYHERGRRVSAWFFDSGTFAPDPVSGEIAMAAMPPELAGLHLRLDDQMFAQRDEDHLVTTHLMLLFLSFFGGMFLILAIGQLRLLLNERAIAVAQSDFVSAVSHEMRTPLTTIKMYADMLQGGLVPEPERQTSYLATISTECDRMARLVENVLDYARISGKKRSYTFERTPACAVIDEALETLAGPLAQSGLSPEIEVPESLVLLVDRDALRQAIVNLVSNAIKYAREGGRLRIAAEASRDGVTLVVQDFGPGIPASEQRKIFEPFYRIGAELTRKAPGTGLGLALVREYLAAHQGKVTLESRPGEGATFRLILPAERKLA